MTLQRGTAPEATVSRADQRRQRIDEMRAESRRVGRRRGALAGFLAGVLLTSGAAVVYEAQQTPNPGCSVVVRSGQTFFGISALIANRLGQNPEQVEAAIGDTSGPINSGSQALMPGDRLNIPAGPDCQVVITDHADFPAGTVGLPMYLPYPFETAPATGGSVGSHHS